MSTYSTNEPHTGNFIVYMNGIEVPAKSVSLRFGVWQIPEMQIEMVADPILIRLGAEDRIQVAVFDYDDIIPDNSKEGPQFRLFGEGEITGWGYTGSGNGRSIVFVVQNQMAIMQQLFVQFVTNVDDLLGTQTRPGGEVTTPTNLISELVFPFSLFKKGLLPVHFDAKGKTTNAAGQDPDSINRPFDYLYNVVRCLAGVLPPERRAVPAANFFARWARLSNFINRFAGSPVFDDPAVLSADPRPNTNIFPILKALQTTAAVDVICKNLLPQIQNSGSFYDMLQLVYQMVFMEVAMIPSMPLVTVSLETSMVQLTDFAAHQLVRGAEVGVFENQKTQTSTPVGQSIPLSKSIPAKAPIPTLPNRIQNYFPKPQFLFGLPPSCNVIFPSQLKTLQYQENYAAQPTRLYFNDEVLHGVLGTDPNGLGEAMMNALTSGYPPEVDAQNQLRKMNAKSTGKNFLIFPEEFFKGPVLDRRTIPTWLYFLKQNEATKTNKTAGASQTQNAPLPIDPDNPDVYHAYAEYEYYRERFAHRTGSAQVAWNPYVVPGFPLAIIDRRDTRVDLFTYVTTVQQRMSHRDRATTLSFTYARTIQEMFDLMAKTFTGASLAFGTGPREPIKEIRNTIQSFPEAEAYYQQLFYGSQPLYGKDACFDWRKIIAYAAIVKGQPAETIFIDGGNAAAVVRSENAQATLTAISDTIENAKKTLATFKQQKVTNAVLIAKLPSPPTSTVDEQGFKRLQIDQEALTKVIAEQEIIIAGYQKRIDDANAVLEDPTTAKAGKVHHNLAGDRELVPTPGAEKLFNNYDDAMKYNWRPRCTLDEYIIFHNSAGEGEIPAFNHPLSVGARYFERIRRLTPLVLHTPRQAGDTVIPTNADGLGSTFVANPDAATVSAPAPGTGTTTTGPSTIPVVPGLPADFPQMRTDWNSLLLQYRANVYYVKAPRT